MKAFASWIFDSASLHLRRLMAAASAGIKGFSAARTSVKFLLGILAVSVPLVILLLQPSSKAIQVAIFVTTLNDPQTNPANGAACSLREAIENVNNPGTDDTGGDCAIDFGSHKIEFSVSGTITLGSTLPDITAIASIDGTGQTIAIDGGGANRILTVLTTVGTLNLANLTIAHGVHAAGGAIFTIGTLTATNVTFFGNSSSDDGGAILTQGTLALNNSTFFGNTTALQGADIYSAGYQVVGQPQTVTNTTFLTPVGGGSAIALHTGQADASITITNSILANSSGAGHNCATLDKGVIADGGHNISDDGSCGFAGTAPMAIPLATTSMRCSILVGCRVTAGQRRPSHFNLPVRPSTRFPTEIPIVPELISAALPGPMARTEVVAHATSALSRLPTP